MTDKRQKATKPKRDESLTKQSKLVEYIYSSLGEAFEFCWSSFADEHNTLVKSTRRNVKLNKFGWGTPSLPDILCKHWFTSLSRWVADVPSRETSREAKSWRNGCFRGLSISQNFALRLKIEFFYRLVSSLKVKNIEYWHTVKATGKKFQAQTKNFVYANVRDVFSLFPGIFLAQKQ